MVKTSLSGPSNCNAMLRQTKLETILLRMREVSANESFLFIFGVPLALIIH